MSEIARINRFDPAAIRTAKQGAEESKLIARAVGLARAIGLKREEVNVFAEKLVRHVRKTGELILKLEREPGGRGKTSHNGVGSFCKEAEISDETAYRWQSVFTGYTDEEFEEKIENLKEEDVIALSDFYALRADTIATKWTGDPESYTPEKYIESARKVLGEIDLDPASNALAQKTVKAVKYLTRRENGLKQPWRGRVFLNPPYSYPEIEEFINKLCAEFNSRSVAAAILLTNNNTDTKWWHGAAKLSRCACFTLGRINFLKADGRESQPTNGQTFFYFGSSVGSFFQEFSQHGFVVDCRWLQEKFFK